MNWIPQMKATAASFKTPGGSSRIYCLFVMVIAVCAAFPARSQETKYFAGIDLVSNYVSNGVTQSNDKPAIQPYFEVARNGFYAGTWLSTVDFGDSDNAEIDLYLGYRNAFENDLFLDVSYARYYYDSSGDCCGEFKLTLAYPLLDRLGVKGYVAYNPETEHFNRRLSLAYEASEKLAFAGTFGRSDFYDHDYWDVGVSYAFNNHWSLGASYQGSGSGDEGLVVRLSLASSQTTLARLLIAPFQR
ncbi:MAG: TorF family putative porin [Roseobacter sp.]|uniref:TorF family putative porin n=1 Tax=Alphaproteobacteria TaxID=28211 RepID=UPI0032638CF5